MVDRNDLRRQDTIDSLCIQLEQLGNPLNVVVNLAERRWPNGRRIRGQNRMGRLCQGPTAIQMQVRVTK